MKEGNTCECSEKTCFPEACSKEAEHLKYCMSICHSCSKKCVDEGQKRTALLCSECADLCALTAKAISYQSEFKDQIMELCAKICEKCAEECKKIKVEHCEECADVCKKCYDCCKCT